MRGAIARPERQDEPGDQVVFSTTSEFFNTAFFDWNLPEARKQVNNSPNFHMANFLYYIPNVWNGEATPLRPLIQPTKVNDEAEFITPRFCNGKTRGSPRRMHGFGQSCFLNSRKFLPNELTVGG
jgi:hypothetical protein